MIHRHALAVFAWLSGFGVTLPAASLHAGGWLGVAIEPVTEIQVSEIIKDSPADKAGLQKGDVLLQLDGAPVTGLGPFTRAIAARDAGSTVTLNIRRNGESQELKVTLAESDDHPAVASQYGQHGWMVQPSQPMPHAMPWNHGMDAPLFPMPGLEQQPGTMTRPGANLRNLPRQQPGWPIRPPAHIAPSAPERATGSSLPHHPNPWQIPPEKGGPDSTDSLAAGAAPGQDAGSGPDPDRPWLGIAMGQGLHGVVVLEVAAASPAEQGGLQAGDIITAVDGDVVDSPGGMSRRVHARQAGESLAVTVRRGDRLLTLNVILSPRPADTP